MFNLRPKNSDWDQLNYVDARGNISCVSPLKLKP